MNIFVIRSAFLRHPVAESAAEGGLVRLKPGVRPAQMKGAPHQTAGRPGRAGQFCGRNPVQKKMGGLPVCRYYYNIMEEML